MHFITAESLAERIDTPTSRKNHGFDSFYIVQRLQEVWTLLEAFSALE